LLKDLRARRRICRIGLRRDVMRQRNPEQQRGKAQPGQAAALR
jgi:hypothetical protein